MIFDVDLFDMKGVYKKIQQYEKNIDKAINNGLEDFADRFQEKLFENAMKYDVPFTVIEDLDIMIHEYQISISISGDEVFYFEYGTGVIGESNPHPKDPWDYDINNHGENGWNYIPTANHHLEYADYIFTGKDGDIVAHTKGMPSKPFIYDTWLWGRRSITQIINKHLNRVK